GHFELSAAGGIVDGEGNALLDVNGRPLLAGAAAGPLAITGDGTISSEAGRIGRIGVVQPADLQKLQAEGAHLFATDAPTAAVAAPRISQGTIEESNVQPSMELNRMMNELREFQFTSQFIQSEADRQQSAIDK